MAVRQLHRATATRYDLKALLLTGLVMLAAAGILFFLVYVFAGAVLC